MLSTKHSNVSLFFIWPEATSLVPNDCLLVHGALLLHCCQLLLDAIHKGFAILGAQRGRWDAQVRPQPGDRMDLRRRFHHDLDACIVISTAENHGDGLLRVVLGAQLRVRGRRSLAAQYSWNLLLSSLGRHDEMDDFCTIVKKHNKSTK